MGKSGYNIKGLYNSYDRNNRERAANDYYATRPGETFNILKTLGVDLNDKIILEPCIGGGHMAEDINRYIQEHNMKPTSLIGTDIKNRGWNHPEWKLEYEKDFFADDYEPNEVDIIICNPPYSVIEPFVIRGLEIATEKMIMLARIQFLEGSGRYENILKDNPPTDCYVYVDRIQCWKNGVDPGGSSAQCYAWFVWDKTKPEDYGTQVHWIKRNAVAAV